MIPGVFLSVAALAVTIGSMHSLAPDHWVPFAVLARSQRWSSWRTARITLLCGLGHVTVSVLIGLLALVAGVRVLEALGKGLESVSGLLLIGFGSLYGLWGLRRAAGQRLHGHSHSHYDHVHHPGKMTAWALFLLFSADPCVAVIPVLFAAAPLGVLRTVAVISLYELATIATMIALVLPAREGVFRAARGKWAERFGDALAGGLIVAVGLLVMLLGW